ncbi:MAG TPA: xanthine dehydrogenase family protein subunit M [Deltaproteobacteria bacterium]|jgi:carbon-monoxide dehydrogenase medium subunit|nr:xanthine dehydrogenase family protein subunit M [Deltaproteobacteria bacterium]MDI9542860.1 xanthine dehydrogenase family protein subunit M [Pseudomonadota bacterium]HPA85918.1 xanthine dehydrogenase family protein subunit M [Deltaproteobacteria bacterium]HPV30664.1 xanthine dehydrogenase family protein subunit M [Deltaproteobacteria bacterium]
MFRTLKPFEYLEPKTLEEATKALSKRGALAKVYAAGVDLVPRMRKRVIEPKCIVNIQNVKELDDVIAAKGKGVRIGSLASKRSIELSSLIKEKYFVLHEAISSIVSVQVKSQGTAVGNLCVATPASDVATALYVLDAKLNVFGPSGERQIPIDEFYLGVGKTVLEPAEIITEILLPAPAANTGGAFAKLVRTAEDIAKVNAAASITLDKGVCKDVRISLGSVAPTVVRAKKAEAILRGKKVDQKLIEQAAKAAAEEVAPITDLRSTAAYRKETSGVLVKRVLTKALERAQA